MVKPGPLIFRTPTDTSLYIPVKTWIDEFERNVAMVPRYSVGANIPTLTLSPHNYVEWTKALHVDIPHTQIASNITRLYDEVIQEYLYAHVIKAMWNDVHITYQQPELWTKVMQWMPTITPPAIERPMCAITISPHLSHHI